MFFGFFNWLLSFFTPSSPQAIKEKQIKRLAKELSHNEFAKFYKPKSKEITSEFALFLYDVYYVFTPIQSSLSNAVKSATFKQIIAESFFDREIEELNEILAKPPEEWAKIGNIPIIVQTFKEKLDAFLNVFDHKQEKAIDCCYNDMLTLIDFINFDYFALLKNFSQEIAEKNFRATPKFFNVQGSLVVDKIMDFLDLGFVVGSYSTWEQFLKIIKLYRDIAVPDYRKWNKTIDKLNHVYGSGVLEKMVRHINEEPLWESKPYLAKERFAREYLQNKQIEVQKVLDKAISFINKTQKETLLMEIFTNEKIQRTEFYTVSNGAHYTNEKFEGFVYAEPLNYLLVFLIDIFNVELKELCNMLIVQGDWINRESYLKMSNHYHEILGLAEKIISFDNKFSNLGDYGSRLYPSMSSADRNRTHAKIASSILACANNEALELINVGVSLLVNIRNALNPLIDDCLQSTHILITNWEELDNQKNPIAARLKIASEKIASFSRLIFFLIGNKIETGVLNNILSANLIPRT